MFAVDEDRFSQIRGCSFNQGIAADVSRWEKDIREEIARQLQGLVELRGGVLRMTDPNGTTPYPPEKLAEVITAPLPNGFEQRQATAARDWYEDSSRFDGNRPRVGLDEKEDMTRLIERCESSPSSQTIRRGMSMSNQKKFEQLVNEIQSKGFYQAKDGKVADSWSMSDSTAEMFTTGDNWQIKLICTRHKSAKDLRPFYRTVQPQSKTPTSPVSTEAELLIPGNVRLKVTKITRQPLPHGQRVTIICKEED